MIAYFAKYGSFFVQGALTTLWMSLGSVICGTLLGIGIALLRTVNKYVGIIGTAYVEYTRGTPLMVQAIIIYYLPALINVNINKYLAGLVAISLNSAAYVAEIIRGGINSVDKGQMEAARSLGMPQGLAMRQVVLPQAIKNILPSLANEFVAVIKESSIISVIGVTELMFMEGVVGSKTYNPLPPLFIASALYFCMTFPLSKLIGVFERRMRASD